MSADNETSTPAAKTDSRHSVAEDIYALLMGSAFAAFGLVLLHDAGLVTGGVAGLALIGSYLTGISVGGLFFLLNLPFLVLAQRTLGWAFAIRSVIAVSLLSVFTAVMPRVFKVGMIDPWFAALFGGTLVGMGVLALARHRCSAGGFGVLALYLYEKRGINAGKIQGPADTLVIVLSCIAVDWRHVLLSVVSALALSLVILAWHKPGRYTGY